MIKICIHRWGKPKQWVKDGEVVVLPRCKKCGEFKSENNRISAFVNRIVKQLGADNT